MNRADEIQKLEKRYWTAVEERKIKSANLIYARLASLKTRQLKEEATMSYESEARDAQRRTEIRDSCRVIKTHVSFIGVASLEIAHMPESVVSLCMDELNEAEGVLKRALARIDQAKDVLLIKSAHSIAAE